jgi:hypothetical protein
LEFGANPCDAPDGALEYVARPPRTPHRYAAHVYGNRATRMRTGLRAANVVGTDARTLPVRAARTTCRRTRQRSRLGWISRCSRVFRMATRARCVHTHDPMCAQLLLTIHAVCRTVVECGKVVAVSVRSCRTRRKVRKLCAHTGDAIEIVSAGGGPTTARVTS